MQRNSDRVWSEFTCYFPAYSLLYTLCLYCCLPVFAVCLGVAGCFNARLLASSSLTHSLTPPLIITSQLMPPPPRATDLRKHNSDSCRYEPSIHEKLRSLHSLLLCRVV